jgi:hypothetical protein
MAEWRDGGMAERRSGGMVFYYDTYLIYPAIFMVHIDDADDDANDNANNTNGFQIIYMYLQPHFRGLFLPSPNTKASI